MLPALTSPHSRQALARYFSKLCLLLRGRIRPRSHNACRAPCEFPAGTQSFGTIGYPARRNGQHYGMLSVRGATNARQTTQHAAQAGHQANSPPTPSHTERWAPPKLNANTTDPKSDARRTPRRHTDTAERWASPKLVADTTQCSARRQRTPRQHTGLAEQRDSPRRPLRTHDEHTTSQRRLSRAASNGSNRARLLTQGSAPPLSGRRTPRQPGGTPPLLLPSVQ